MGTGKDNTGNDPRDGGRTAGFPSPADDYIDMKLDLNDCLVKHPAATFFVRVSGDLMSGAGICDGDILVVDRSCKPAEGSVVIVSADNGLKLGKVRKVGGRYRVFRGNSPDKAIEFGEGEGIHVWGVVKHAIRSF